MKDRLWRFIWKTGRLVCPVCYRKMWDSEPFGDAVSWACHHCEIETEEPEYSWYWPFDVIKGYISYWVYMNHKRQQDSEEVE